MNEIYNFLIDIELINNNPLSRIKNLKEIKNHKIRALTSNEVKILLNTTKKYDYEFYPLLFTALFTGMRQGELLGLTWNSINWNSKKITVDKNYTHGNLGTTKSGKIRIVDMSKELVQVLKRWHLRCPLSKFGLVFPNKEGNYLNAANMLNRKFKPALKRAGIEPVRFHDLRHTYASLLIANGVSMKYVQYQLGHSSIKMTMDLYTHILPEFNENCVNILDNLVNNLTKDFVQNVLTIKNYAT